MTCGYRHAADRACLYSGDAYWIQQLPPEPLDAEIGAPVEWQPLDEHFATLGEFLFVFCQWCGNRPRRLDDRFCSDECDYAAFVTECVRIVLYTSEVAA